MTSEMFDVRSDPDSAKARAEENSPGRRLSPGGASPCCLPLGYDAKPVRGGLRRPKPTFHLGLTSQLSVLADRGLKTPSTPTSTPLSPSLQPESEVA
jgi:hypothetical protein